MENGLILKTWNMDYQFLINNYLNPEMWDKQWTLFQYKGYTIKLNLYSIRVKSSKILFDITLYWRPGNGSWERTIEKSCEYSLKTNDIQFLKRAINSSIWSAIQSMEEYYMIKEDDEYMKLLKLETDERDKLRDICSNFLDEKGIDNDNLRSAYTEAYIDEYAKIPDIKRNYIDNMFMEYIGDLALVWAECLDMEKEKEMYVSKIKNALSNSKFETLKTEYEEYKVYMETEQFKSDMENKLDNI